MTIAANTRSVLTIPWLAESIPQIDSRRNHSNRRFGRRLRIWLEVPASASAWLSKSKVGTLEVSLIARTVASHGISTKNSEVMTTTAIPSSAISSGSLMIKRVENPVITVGFKAIYAIHALCHSGSNRKSKMIEIRLLYCFVTVMEAPSMNIALRDAMPPDNFSRRQKFSVLG